MNKKITIELTQEEYDALAKSFDSAKKSSFISTKALNIDDFAKDIVVTFVKGPPLDSLKDLDPSELLNGLGSLDEIKDLLGNMKKKTEKKEEKKDEIPDEQKYKS